jgi:hypothetical protein
MTFRRPLSKTSESSGRRSVTCRPDLSVTTASICTTSVEIRTTGTGGAGLGGTGGSGAARVTAAGERVTAELAPTSWDETDVPTESAAAGSAGSAASSGATEGVSTVEPFSAFAIVRVGGAGVETALVGVALVDAVLGLGFWCGQAASPAGAASRGSAAWARATGWSPAMVPATARLTNVTVAIPRQPIARRRAVGSSSAIRRASRGERSTTATTASGRGARFKSRAVSSRCVA